MAKLNTTEQILAEFARVLDTPDLPSDEARTESYNAELINRYRTRQFLTETDKREARRLISGLGA